MLAKLGSTLAIKLGVRIFAKQTAKKAAKRADGLPKVVNWGQQEKHFLGHKSYVPGRSQLTADPRKLIERAGSGRAVNSVPRGQPGFRERIDFGEEIGTYINLRTGVELSTTRAILVYGKRGIHIFPVRPR